ncbi:GNAT family N-acetyltransferase [Agrilactobacillus fermenti]|uniref:GNAT family N-acetyltransferase n=1 Tax=Agrilactobacillus fermenti TaxID=2586909 RepID=UPI001E2FFA07|nr:GNAT family N-acetyltransferase [Agrilactobacillus fermenti]MCD2256396.1 GNAT family N-acetyltransferase [Agrilactobacillus fermenti]
MAYIKIKLLAHKQNKAVRLMLKIRQAQPKDYSQIGQVYLKSWQTAYRTILPAKFLNDLSADLWIPRLAVPKRLILVAETDQGIIGVVTGGKSSDQMRPNWAELMSIYLLPDYFHQGIGQKLLATFERKIYAQGYQQIFLWVLANNDSARRFYEKCGFQLAADTHELDFAGETVSEVRYLKKMTL